MFLVFFVVYATATGFRFPWIALGATAVAIAAFYFGSGFRTNTLLWSAISVLCLLDILEEWTRPANHHYILFYLSLIFLMASAGLSSGFRWNMRILLGLLLLFAGTQKLLSDQYMNGSFLQFLFITGDLASHSLFPNLDTAPAVVNNLEQLKNLDPTDPNLGGSIHLEHVFGFGSKPFVFLAWVSALLELLGGVLIFFFWRSSIAHYFLIGVTVSIFVLRPECGFLSLLCIAGYGLTEDHMRSARAIYLGLLIVFLSLVIVRFGYP